MIREDNNDNKAKDDPALPPDYQVRDKGAEMEQENEESLHNAYRNRKKIVTDPASAQSNKERGNTNSTKANSEDSK